MTCTFGMCKKNLSDSKISFQNVINALRETFPEKIDSAIQVMDERAKDFGNISSIIVNVIKFPVLSLMCVLIFNV